MELLNWLFRDYFIAFINLGLFLGLAMGVLILLRPVTVRLLTPGQRVFLWGTVWVVGAIPTLFATLAVIPFPSLRELAIPRAEGGYPRFFPEIQTAGAYRLALPGGQVIPFQVSPEWVQVLGWLGLLFLAVTLFLGAYSDRGVKRMARSGVELDQARYRQLGVEKVDNLVVRLCPNLPTSFVIRRWGRHEIALQKELTQEQLRLVLLHEREHVRRHDPWLQGLVVVAVCFYFWNPVLWLAYHFTRRDMELACDRRVLNQLGEKERRAYARTLVDLACDSPRWGGLTTFGECDASRRVKAATRWAPEDEADGLESRRLLGWGLAVLMAAFLVVGGPVDRAITADLVADLEEIQIWDYLDDRLEEQGVAADRSAPLWLTGDGTWAWLTFRDREGGWWEAMVRREQYRGGVEFYVDYQGRSPDLSGCVEIPWPVE